MSDAHENTIHPDENLKLGAAGRRFATYAGAAGGSLIVIAAALALIKGDTERFLFGYLIAVVFCTTIALGALFFVILHHLVGAKWSTVVRRISEILSSTFPVLGALFGLGVLLPMLFGNDELYLWTETIAPNDHSLLGKTGWLNVPFFALRIAVYYTAWTLLSRYFFKKSVEQDETGDLAISKRLRVVAAPAMIGFGFLINYSSFDIMMSLDPHFFSTMFGVYIFSGSVLAIFATLGVVNMVLQEKGYVVHSITVEHYHDTGKMMFAFVFFWGYIAFSQFMLIWYADIPEETFWYHERMFDWTGLSLLLVFGHFFFPFVCLLSRWTKRWLKLHMGFAIWLLIMHYCDLYWLAMPERNGTNQVGAGLGLFMDIACVIGVLCIFIAAAAWQASRVNLIPIKDPHLSASLGFENF